MDDDNVIDDVSSGAATRSVFKPAHSISRFFSGSVKCSLCPSGLLASASLDRVNLVSLEQGRAVSRVVLAEEELVACFAVRPVLGEAAALDLVIATKTLELKHFRVPANLAETPVLVRSWKSHTMPITAMLFDPTGTVVACGSSDGRIFIYDLAQGHTTHALRGHAGPILCLCFHPDVHRVMLLSGSQDGSLRCWDLRSSDSKLLKGHMGAVADCCIVSDNVMVSVGRDRVLIVWDLKKCVSVHTVPLYEELSSVVALQGNGAWSNLLGSSANDELVLLGGALGVIKVFHVGQKRVIFERKDERLEFAIEQLLVPEGVAQPLVVVTRDQNLLRLDPSSVVRCQQIVGDLDEVVDAKIFGKLSDTVAVATNSKDVKLWHVVPNDWELLGGHTNTVLALGISKSERFLCSGSKDTTVRLWDVSVQPAASMAVLEGHTDSVNAVAFGGDSFVVSAGKDRTIKVWKLDKGATAAVYTCIGQAAEINCLDVSPNEQLIASGGADKRILLWNVTKPLSSAPALGKKLIGHKRGIWDVRFSPIDKRLASCSGDRTVRIWNVGSGECLRVMEGHLAATLKVRWISSSTQLVSSGSDGMIRVWNGHDGSAAATLDEEQHSAGGKIWALDAARDGELLLSGGSDGALVMWKDETRESNLASIREKQRQTELKQQMDNLVLKGELVEALAMALQLDHRAQSKKIVEMIRRQSADPRQALVGLVRDRLTDESLELLVKLCGEWNKTATNSSTAQFVMEAVFVALPADRLAKSPAVRASVEAWIAFSQRHLQRITHLVSSSFVLDHCLELMGGAIVEESLEQRLPMQELVDQGPLEGNKRLRE